MERLFSVITALILLGALLAVPLHIANWNLHRETVTITVEEKDRVANSNGGSESRVYTERGVYGVGDDPINGQFNSADVYAEIEVGKTYRVETVGFRNGFLSMFPNILTATEAN